MTRSIWILIILMGFSFSIMGGIRYLQEKSNQPETMPLVPMMQQLLNDIQQIDRGIFTENFSLIEEGAENISDHPTMTPGDKKLVKETLGKQMKQFVKFDRLVHYHADSVRLAAVEKDMKMVLNHYRIVQHSCVDCHSDYRGLITTARTEQNK